MPPLEELPAGVVVKGDLSREASAAVVVVDVKLTGTRRRQLYEPGVDVQGEAVAGDVARCIALNKLLGGGADLVEVLGRLLRV
jgi:hypothetical protein